MENKTFFIIVDSRPLDHLCSGTEELEQSDLSVWLDYMRWYQVALTREILGKIEAEKLCGADNV